MTGDRLMLGLAGFYIVLAVVYAVERNWPKCQYWLGAFLITSAVLMMK
jgi:hypothetical protein